jgi:hypothetical protein
MTDEKGYPSVDEALACVERNGGVHRWGAPVLLDLVPNEPLYGVDCEDCRMPATGRTAAGAMDTAQAIDRLDRALIDPEPSARGPEAEAER